MALLFSAVTMKSGEAETRFLVGGIPRIKNDLKGWTAYENFIRKANGEIEVQVDSYAYGGETLVKATVEEVAYLTKRLESRTDFLERSCDLLGRSQFTIKNEKGEGGWRFMGEAVHRIVATAFLGDPPSQKENKILHLDRNPFNNCPCNLRWASKLELTIWRKESNFRIRQLTGTSIREFLSNPQNYRHCFDYEIDLDWLCSVWPETTHRALKKIEKWEEELGTSCVLDVPSPNAATVE